MKDGNVKFIKVRGRVVPVRGKDTPEKKAARSAYKAGGTAAITGALLGTTTGAVSKISAITANAFALSATRLPRSNPLRSVLADKAVKQAKLSMKLSKISKFSKATAILGLGVSLSGLGYLIKKNYKYVRQKK